MNTKLKELRERLQAEWTRTQELNTSAMLAACQPGADSQAQQRFQRMTGQLEGLKVALEILNSVDPNE